VPSDKKDSQADASETSTTTTAVVPARPAATTAPVVNNNTAQEAKLPIHELDDPKDLFGMLGDLSDHDGVGKPNKQSLVQELKVPNTSATKPNQGKFGRNKTALISEVDGKKPIISEVSSDKEEAQPLISKEKTTSKKKKKGKPVVKKGFLFNDKAKKAKPLYEEGSSEGRGEHPWNKLMGRSKVVDMNDMTPEQQAAYAKDGTVPKNVGKGPNDTKTDTKAEDYADAEFEELMQIADPDYGLEAKNRRQAGDEMNDEMARWTTIMNPEIMGSPNATPGAAEKMKEDLKAKAVEKKRLKKEKKSKLKRPGTTDYSKFEEISEDAELVSSDEKLERLRRKREALELKMKQEKAQEEIREQERKFKEQQETEKDRKRKERADRRPGTLDYSKFEEIDENSELLDAKEAAAKRTQVEQGKRKAEEDRLAAIAVAKEAERFKAQQTGSPTSLESLKACTAEQPQKEGGDKDKKVWSFDVNEKAAHPDEILEMGADGSFDFDIADAAAANLNPAFDLKGKLGNRHSGKKIGKSSSQASKANSDGLPIPAHRVKRVKGEVAGTHKYCLVVELPGLTSMNGVELDVSAKLVRLKAKGYGELKVSLNEIVDENRVAAKFSKKKRELSVKVPIL